MGDQFLVELFSHVGEVSDLYSAAQVPRSQKPQREKVTHPKIQSSEEMHPRSQ